VACDALHGAGWQAIQVSSLQRTIAIGGETSQPSYLNAAVRGRTSQTWEEVRELLADIERQAGRVRGERWGPRTCDLDLLLYGDLVLRRPDWVVPHPRLTVRRFVLEPACEIAGDCREPVSGLSLRELLQGWSQPWRVAEWLGPERTWFADFCRAWRELTKVEPQPTGKAAAESPAGGGGELWELVDPSLPDRQSRVELRIYWGAAVPGIPRPLGADCQTTIWLAQESRWQELREFARGPYLVLPSEPRPAAQELLAAWQASR
jgi:2-amino-4-hydroxy-6-hydroxymethyldihydropteridine diphosphokinase